MYFIIIIFLVGLGHYMFKANKVKNVFDEMYYAEFQSFPKLYTSTSYSKLIRANILKCLPLNVRNYFPHAKNEYYRADAVNENEYLKIGYYKVNDKNSLKILGLRFNEKDDGSLRFYFIYEVETKKLKIVKPDILLSEDSDTDSNTNDPKEVSKFMQKNDLTEEDLADYQDYFLYEKVLTDWFTHNPKSRFSLDDLGDVEIVETDVYEE